MADQRIQATENMIGANHPTLTDTLNRLTLVSHETDGTHKASLSFTTPNIGVATGTSLDVSGNLEGDQVLIGSGVYSGTASYSAAKGVYLGAISNHKTSIISNNTTVAEFSSTGLTVTGKTITDTFRFSGVAVPASASAAGTLGEITWDSGYLYICIATNTWKRAQLSTW